MKNLIKNNKIDALIPVYANNIGNCTEVIINDSSHIVTKTVETCIKNLADYYNISLYHNRLNYGKELGITNKVPIVINENLIYIYVNVRKPMFDHDSAYGYLNYFSIDDVLEQNSNAAIILKSGIVIQTRQSINVTKKNMLYARIAKDIYKEKNYLK